MKYRAFLLPLPVGWTPGVGKITETRMAQVGIKTVRDIYAMEENGPVMLAIGPAGPIPRADYCRPQ